MVSTANGLRICRPRCEWTESVPMLACVGCVHICFFLVYSQVRPAHESSYNAQYADQSRSVAKYALCASLPTKAPPD